MQKLWSSCVLIWKFTPWTVVGTTPPEGDAVCDTTSFAAPPTGDRFGATVSCSHDASRPRPSESDASKVFDMSHLLCVTETLLYEWFGFRKNQPLRNP